MKILMRMGKNPFSIVSAEDILNKDLIGRNIGNSLFQVASHKLLTTNTSTVTAYKFTPDMEDVDLVNKNYDLFVIPLANAFRVSYKQELDRHTEFINKINIPVVVLGVGAQTHIDCTNFSDLKSIEASVKNFCDAVLKKSFSIGVRGKCTLKYLKSLGYKSSQIDIIGCPSMFWHGSKIYVNKKLTNLYKDSKISFNLTPYMHGAHELLIEIIKQSKNIIYIPQGNADLEKLLYGANNIVNNALDDLVEKYFYKRNKIIFCLEPKRWLDFLESCHFSLGTRIHGAIASILAGTPAHIFVHDSRTKELAQYFEIPHTPIDNITSINIDTIYQNSDFTNLVNNHSKRFDTIATFLGKNNLGHIFEDSNKNVLSAYENTYYSTNFENNIEANS